MRSGQSPARRTGGFPPLRGFAPRPPSTRLRPPDCPGARPLLSSAPADAGTPSNGCAPAGTVVAAPGAAQGLAPSRRGGAGAAAAALDRARGLDPPLLPLGVGVPGLSGPALRSAARRVRPGAGLRTRA